MFFLVKTSFSNSILLSEADSYETVGSSLT